MVKRNIIEINEKKCNGCGKCIPNCPEGAIQMIDNKAKLVSDLFCDGLGACLGHCPQGAITIIEREAEPYSETKVMERIVKQGKNVIKAHLEHLDDHGELGLLKEAEDFLKEKGIENPVEKKTEQKESLPCGCPGTKVMEVKPSRESPGTSVKQASELRQWPVQLALIPANAPYFEGADLLISSDCVPFANPNFHALLLKGKRLVVGCPKLDDIEAYKEKLTDIFKSNSIKSITVAIMEVPWCYGMFTAVEQALKESGKEIPLEKKIISVQGDTKQ